MGTKVVWGVALCLACMLGPIAALAAEGPYLGLQVGAVFANDRKAGVIDEIDFEPGIAGGLSLGYDFGERYAHARLEGEVAYRQSHMDEITIFGQTRGAYGDVGVASLLGNGFYVFDNPTVVKPYLMGGLGAAGIFLMDAETMNVVIADDEQVAFAYQVGAGIDFDISDRFAIGLGYRFFATSKATFQDETGDKFDFNYKANNVGLDFRMSF